MGDDLPPCELNKVSKAGEHFGFPFCHGKDILDPEFGKGKLCSSYTAPMHTFTAHSSPLGMRFMKSKDLKGSILVARHGSWNRSSPVGYDVLKVSYDSKGKVTGAEDFATGFLRSPRAWGRPVDVLEMADGSILLSDDEADAVYRISK
jgi:glucose/arabinose dehydrogenase